MLAESIFFNNLHGHLEAIGDRLFWLAQIFWVITFLFIAIQAQREAIMAAPIVAILIDLSLRSLLFFDCVTIQFYDEYLANPGANHYRDVCPDLPGTRNPSNVRELFHAETAALFALVIGFLTIIALQSVWYRQRRPDARRWRSAAVWCLTLLGVFLVGLVCHTVFLIAIHDYFGFIDMWIVNIVTSSMFLALVWQRPNGVGLSGLSAWAMLFASVALYLYFVVDWAQEVWPRRPDQKGDGFHQLPFASVAFVIVFCLDVIYLRMLAKRKTRDV